MSFVVLMIVIGTDAYYDGRRLDPRCNIKYEEDERRILLGHQSRSRSGSKSRSGSGSRCGSSMSEQRLLILCVRLWNSGHVFR